MARQARNVKYSILIVCEGTVSEPSYFWGLKNEARGLDAGSEEIVVTIDPRPREDNSGRIVQNPHKSARVKRQLQNRDSVIVGEVEPEYAADPVRYVRIAQLGLMHGTYDEAYTVFDKDGHPKRSEAFALSGSEIDGKKVQIGFSSISFEHWVLLHFEPNGFPFEKSECKDDSKHYLGCGESGNSTGCSGNRCCAGYIRQQGYFPYEKTGANLWSDLRDKLTVAFRNAAALRSHQELANPAVPISDLNPYTDLDLVIGKILRVKHFFVGRKGHPIEMNGFEFTVSFTGTGKVRCEILNKMNVSQICKLDYYFSDHVVPKGHVAGWREILEPGESGDFELAVPSSFEALDGYFNVETEGNTILAVAFQ